MTAVELRLTLLQEVATILDDEALVKKALKSIRRMKQATIKAYANEDKEPTKEEMLNKIAEGLKAVKARKEGKDTTGMFRNVNELLNEI